MSQNTNRLLGFPLKVFVRSKPPSDSAKPETKVIPANNDGQEVREFYENLPASSRCEQPLPAVGNSGGNSLSASDLPSSASKTAKSVSYSLNQLFQAVSSNDLRLVSEAIRTKIGRDILTRRTDHFGWTALMVASCNGHLDIADLLIRRCAVDHIWRLGRLFLIATRSPST